MQDFIYRHRAAKTVKVKKKKKKKKLIFHRAKTFQKYKLDVEQAHKKLQDFYLNMADLWLDKLLMFCIFSACSCLHSGVPFAVLIQDGASVVTAVCPPGRLVFRIYLQP